jgi:hypothetical protein
MAPPFPGDTGPILRTISDDGSRVFFDSPDQLVPGTPAATQHTLCFSVTGCIKLTSNNVYAWESGQLHLIAAGAASSVGAQVVATTPSGNDVFFATSEQLAPTDTDGAVDVYDARVGGGFPIPSFAACEGAECQGAATSPPSFPTAATVTFSGPGNLSPGAAPATVEVLSRVVHGSTFLLHVNVPAKGWITIRGSGSETVSRFVAKAGTYLLRVRLAPKARRMLARKGKLRLTLRVGYAPASGPGSAVTVAVTVKPAVRRRNAHGAKARRADLSRGGGR